MGFGVFAGVEVSTVFVMVPPYWCPIDNSSGDYNGELTSAAALLREPPSFCEKLQIYRRLVQ
jgi:hypothetical protein